METNAKEKDDKSAGRLSIMHDLYVDLLGSLVPGLLTVIMGGTAIALALATTHSAIFGSPVMADGFPGGLKDLVTGLHWEFATVMIVSAYVIGAVFFRQDPKIPDSASALHVWINSKRKERNGLAVQSAIHLPPIFDLRQDDDKLPMTLRIRAYLRPNKYTKLLALDTQFPYLHLRCYLLARGLTHLIPLVPWCPDEKDSKMHRTKMFINVLKVRLLALFPNFSRDVIRNEAHVRLATSVWYASTALMYLTIGVLVLLATVAALSAQKQMHSSLFVAGSYSLLMLLFCIGMRHHLRKCIHYMRVREVIYVLETAYMAASIREEPLFADLLQKSNNTECNKCSHVNPVACQKDAAGSGPLKMKGCAQEASTAKHADGISLSTPLL